MKLYNIFYVGDSNNPRCYEGTTDDFEKWLKYHNSERDEDCAENEDEFDVEEIHPILFNKEEE